MLKSDSKRDFALEVVRRLRTAGHVAYWAGGCVRDQLLGLAPKDYDVATDAHPERIREIFGRRRTLAIGAAFGVISVLGRKADGHVEVATFRQDVSYSDGRHPDAVQFSSPEADAQRRDFTINGLFFDPIEERVLDYVGGQEDLNRGLVRAIGNPEERLAEDKLRMLRAVRFAATFSFVVDESTFAVIREMAPQISVVSAERVAQELERMLVHPTRARAVALLRDSGLLEATLPLLHEAFCARSGPPNDGLDDAFAETLALLQSLVEPSFPLAFSALLAPVISAADAQATCRRLKLSNETRTQVRWLVQHFDSLWAALEMPWNRLQRVLISPYAADLVTLHTAQLAAGWDRPAAALEFCRERLTWPPERLNPAPLIGGDDLLALGMTRGKIFAEILERVRDEQLDGHIIAKEEALGLARQLYELARTSNPT
jgi:poly(A) polymerase